MIVTQANRKRLFNQTPVVTIPTAPQNLTLTIDSANSLVVLDWTEETSADATSYQAGYRLNGDPNYIWNTAIPDSLFTDDITGLTSGNSYDFAVRAINSAGTDAGSITELLNETITFATTVQPFIMNVDSGANSEFDLRTVGSDYNVATSDGQNLQNQSNNITISFPAANTVYTLSITGSIGNIELTFSASILDLLSVEQWGIYSSELNNDQSGAFSGCSNLVINATDQPDFSETNNIRSFINGCVSITEAPVVNAPLATDAFAFANDCTGLTTVPAMDWSNIQDMQSSFQDCPNLISFGITDISSCTNLRSTFQGDSSLVTLNLTNTGNVVDWRSAFNGCFNLLPFFLDTSSGKFFSATFQNNRAIVNFPLLDFSLAELADSLWNGCFNMETLSITPTDFGLVANFSRMLADCRKLQTLPLFDTSNGTTFVATFDECFLPTDLPNYDFSSATSFLAAFRRMTSLANVPAGIFDNCLATNFSQAFTITNLTQVSIDNILVSINSNSTSNGTFEQSGGSAPSATGEAAIDAMRARGWTVTVTGGY